MWWLSWQFLGKNFCLVGQFQRRNISNFGIFSLKTADISGNFHRRTAKKAMVLILAMFSKNLLFCRKLFSGQVMVTLTICSLKPMFFGNIRRKTGGPFLEYFAKNWCSFGKFSAENFGSFRQFLGTTWVYSDNFQRKSSNYFDNTSLKTLLISAIFSSNCGAHLRKFS